MKSLRKIPFCVILFLAAFSAKAQTLTTWVDDIAPIMHTHCARFQHEGGGGKDGLPVFYEYDVIEEIELYDLREDISETENVADNHPEVVEKLKVIAFKMHLELGDRLKGLETGLGSRSVGLVITH